MVGVIYCRGQARGYARHADDTKDCPDHLAPAWLHWYQGKWIKAEQKLVVKCDSSAPNTTNVNGAAKENSPNIVETEKQVTTTATTSEATIVTTTATIQTTTTGLFSFFQDGNNQNTTWQY